MEEVDVKKLTRSKRALVIEQVLQVRATALGHDHFSASTISALMSRKKASNLPVVCLSNLIAEM